MIKKGEVINLSLIPKNEAEYPEFVKAKVLQTLPSKDKQLYLAKLLHAPKQDFGYCIGELLVVHVSYEEDKMFAFCEGAAQKV
ncbi:MAG: hypothetical protein ACQESH_07410 [Campylobacterota bacterium]